MTEDNAIKCKKDPVHEVIFQVRYPVIIKVSTDITDFQGKVRRELPDYETQFPNLNLPNNIPAFVSDSIIKQKAIHIFSNEESTIQVNLSSDSFSLIFTGEYIGFIEILGNIIKYLEIFEKIYEPSSYIRTGLVYRNLISEGFIDEWKEYSIYDIINNDFKGFLSIEENCLANELESNATFSMPNDVKVNYLRRIAQVNGNIRELELKDKTCYLFDIDAYTENKIIGTENAKLFIERFKNNINQFFTRSFSEKSFKTLTSK